MTVRLVLDTGPGIEDAPALLFALRRPGLSLAAVTTVFGNADVATTTANALRLLDLFGRPDNPVAGGAGRGLAGPFAHRASHIHGADGLGGVALPPPSRGPLDISAPELLVRLARENPGALTLAAVGPLTNLALALLAVPEVARLLRRVVVMGGTLQHPGIPGPMAEANFWSDPEAARIVLHSGARVEIVGMDVTMRTLLREEEIARLAARGDGATRAAMAMARSYLDAYRRQYPAIAGVALHDPLAVALAEDPSLAVFEPMACDVECRGEITRGQLVADRRRVAPNALVAIEADGPRFLERFLSALSPA
jgi:purine nucleosidase